MSEKKNPIPDYMEVLGPMWQYECGRCGEVGDVYDSAWEAEASALRHDCITSSRVTLYRQSDGTYEGRIGDPLLGYVTVRAEVVDEDR